MLKAILPHQPSTLNPYDALTPDERDEFNAWIESCHAGTPDSEPHHFANRLYPDLEIYEVLGYGRVWIDREGYWHHNGPKVGFFNICRERFEDAMSDLIQAVHLHLDPKGVQS